MKTAISIPDEVYERAERLARQTKRSRSKLFTDAIDEYLSRHAADEITEAMNDTLVAVGESSDTIIKATARRRLEQTEW